MLPPRPNRTGLPAAPRARSVGRSRSDNVERNASTVLSQQSPPLSKFPPSSAKHPRNYERSFSHDSNQRSDTSSVSSSSSFMDRMKYRPGDTSSHTSLEEEDLPKRGRYRSAYTPEPEDLQEESAPANGEGYSLWARVAGAAGTLTVSVSKAWQTNVPTYTGEETPPGEESRLTRALKAYHIAKAGDPSDLPEWLFEAHERRPVGRSRFVNRDSEEPKADDTRSHRNAPDGYRPAGRLVTDDDNTPSKATNRLKAMRDAKRNVHSGAATSSYNDQVAVDSGGNYDGRPRGPSGRRPPPSRTGLPSGPGARTGRF